VRAGLLASATVDIRATKAMQKHNPFINPAPRDHLDGDFLREEVILANRNHGVLLEALRHDVTPAGMHYLLNHFDVPYVEDEAAWRLKVTGHVGRALSLSMSEIKALPARTLRVTLECAGNGRGQMTPRWPSMPWMSEAVGTGEWTGTPLKGVLAAAGLKPGAIDVSFTGIDRGFDKGDEHEYGRSLRIEQALGEDVLLVHGMNGQPLLPQHGFPLRLIVPGWYGMASVKWLDRIEVLDRPYQGYQQVQTYKFRKAADDPGIPITTMRVKSLMVPPGIPDWYTRRRLVEAGNVTIRGRAWSGDATPIETMEVAVDGQWAPAVLDPPGGKYAWRGWRFDWSATLGDHELMCRATDATGAVQPLDIPYDRGGFGNNAVQRVQVTVR
jgi:DMSO/TMAO reductase YedYZ molybdopterin-dependent catalytic subunit